MNVPAGATAPIVVVGAGDLTKARLTRNEASVKRLARVTEITHASDTPKNSAQLVLNEATICLPLGSLIDLDAERARLTKEQGKVQGDMDKINAKLGNERFVANAKEEVVTAERARHAELTLELQKIAEALVKLEHLQD
jgi:valyl-tRNA synthetase